MNVAPILGSVAPANPAVLAARMDVRNTRLGQTYLVEELVVRPAIVGAGMASLADAIAAARKLSAGEAAGIAIVQDGARFVLHGADVRSTRDGGTRILPATSDLVAQAFGKGPLFGGFLDIAASMTAFVDDDDVLVPTVRNAGSRIEQVVLGPGAVT